jgi:heat shock protein HtpX
MATLYTHSDSNTRKTWFLMIFFSAFVMIVGYIFSLAMDNSFILYIVVAFSIVSSFISYWWSDKIVLKMSDAKLVKFEDNKELYRIVENLCITAGLPLPRIYIINDTAPNAFATGRDPEHAVVAVTAGLLQKLDRNELEGVIAHELSHVGNRDILIATITTVLVGFIVLQTFFYSIFYYFFITFRYGI